MQIALGGDLQHRSFIAKTGAMTGDAVHMTAEAIVLRGDKFAQV